MGKNSDTSNIFSSYMDNVLLKEAVKPTEVEGTATSQAEKDPKWMQAKSAWENMTGKKLDQMPANQKISISQNVLKPAAQKGYLENPRTKERTPISGGESAAQSVPTTTPAPQQPAAQPAPVSQPATQAAPVAPAAPQPAQQPQADDESGYEEVETTQETIPANVQAQPLVTADDGTSYTVDQIKNMIGDVTKSFDQDEQESDDEGWEEMGSSDDKENVTDKYETVISGNTTTIRPKNLKEPFEDQDDQEEEGWQEVGEPETENVTDQYTSTTSEAQYKESVNIAKFLKSLSEKNYSLANKYLKNIVENKIKRKISGEIK